VEGIGGIHFLVLAKGKKEGLAPEKEEEET